MNKTIRFNKDRSKNVKAIANQLSEFYNEHLANGKRPQYPCDSICRVYLGLKLMDDILGYDRENNIDLTEWYLQQLDIFDDYKIEDYRVYWQVPFDPVRNYIEFIFVHK
jgi:hypothetical protein